MTNDDDQIETIQDELRDLRTALEQADDGAQATRLRMMIASRESQLAHIRKQRRGTVTGHNAAA